MPQWVYFADHSEAVRLEHYRRHEDEYTGREIAYVLDTRTGERSPELPKPRTKPPSEQASDTE